MGVLLVFAAGYVMGARAGGESLDEVVEAMHAIRESEEFHDFLKALRNHTAHSLRNIASMLENGRGSGTGTGSGTDGNAQSRLSSDLLERVRLIVGWR
ncbi:MAG TPA: hypothetical protein VH761_17065 [Ilumatobacteraceae bacterium]|jgi:hypothetical protein